MPRRRAVAERHLEIALIGVRTRIPCREFIEAAVVAESLAADKHLRTLRRVDSRQHDVGRIFAPANHETALREHKRVKFVNPHVAGVDLAQKRRQNLALGIQNVILKLGK